LVSLILSELWSELIYPVIRWLSEPALTVVHVVTVSRLFAEYTVPTEERQVARMVTQFRDVRGRNHMHSPDVRTSILEGSPVAVVYGLSHPLLVVATGATLIFATTLCYSLCAVPVYGLLVVFH
jgi:hypothetical protein